MFKIIQIILMNVLVIFNTHAETQPKFTLTPLTDTTLIMFLDQTVVVKYRVTNQTNTTRTLTIVPIPGVIQTTAGTGVCAAPFTLAHGQSCVLTLSLYGRHLSENTIGGPKVCKTQRAGNTHPTPFLCSQPSFADQLNITRLPIERAILFANPSLLTFEPNGASQTMEITNASTTITARDVHADFKNTALDGNVTQDASACSTLLPGAHCNLVFTPGSTAVSKSSFPIYGTNTQTVAGKIEVVSPSAATITTKGSPVELDRNDTQTLTVNNTSLSLDANDIAAHNVPTGVTASACTPNPTPHGSSCTITFTSASTPVEQTTINIYGTNTSQTTATVTVNPSVNIAFLSPSSLLLTTSGTSTGRMIIQNTSSSTITGGLIADFSGTALSGSVEASGCEGDLAAGATCAITFKAGFTKVPETAFPIHGVVASSTNSLVGTIAIVADLDRAILFNYPPSLTFEPNGPSQSMMITNSSKIITARNVRADFTNTALDGTVNQDASQCSTILPGAHCNLVFTPGSTAVSNSSFPIYGINTQMVAGNIEVISPTAATITAEGSPIELDRNETQILTVNNTSLSLDANGITAHNVPAGVTASACTPDPTPYGGSCTITLTSGSTPVEQTTITIYGSNTTQTTATVTVNPSDNIAFVSSSSLILTASGTSTGQMILQNTSSATISGGLMADFSGTALSGSVEATGCEEDLIPGATCAITFKAALTNVLETAFPIHGVVASSTNSLVGTITVVPSPVAYLTTPSGNSLSQCSIQSETNHLTNCQIITGLGLSEPHGMTLDPTHTHVYIVNRTGSTVTYCDIDTKSLNPVNCRSAAANGLNTPVGIAINPAGTYAYVTNTGNNTVSKCTIQGDGGFNNTCINSGASSMTIPNAIVIKPTNDFAYVSNTTASKMIQCAISDNGNLSGCISVWGGINDFSTGITINNNIIYEIARGSDGHIHEFVCTLVNGGGVTGCTIRDLLFGAANNTGMIAISTITPTAYIGFNTANQYIQCILSSNGLLTGCAITTTTPGNNWGVALLE